MTNLISLALRDILLMLITILKSALTLPHRDHTVLEKYSR